MKIRTSWYSQRLQREVQVVRWGEVGVPLLIFPTAGGDAEEIERFRLIETLSDFLGEGRIKIYSCDGVSGQALLEEEGTPSHRMWLMNQFQHFVRWELVPAVRTDCKDESIELVAAGASIGAFHALASVCRFPDVFSKGLCMSGTYDLSRFFEVPLTDDFWYASPLHWLPGFTDMDVLAQLRKRSVLLAAGEGEAEDIGESWSVAGMLGDLGVTNRVDSWGTAWKHDWPTWRNMLRQYIPELIPAR